MTKPISPLRQRMLDDMALRNMSPSTRKVYTQAVADYARYFGQTPSSMYGATGCISSSAASRQPRSTRSSARSDSIPSLDRKEIAEDIPFARNEDTLAAVMTPAEVVRLLEAVDSAKMRTALTTIYTAGLRVSEVVALTATDIDSQRMVIHIGHGKGGKSLRDAV